MSKGTWEGAGDTLRTVKKSGTKLRVFYRGATNAHLKGGPEKQSEQSIHHGLGREGSLLEKRARSRDNPDRTTAKRRAQDFVRGFNKGSMR